MDQPTRADLLRAHPRIGDDPAALAGRSPLSYQEQGANQSRVPETTAILAALNDRYEARFGFPFVEWVAGRPPEAIVEVLERRLARHRSVQMEAGCIALVAIAQDRLRRLCQ